MKFLATFLVALAAVGAFADPDLIDVSVTSAQLNTAGNVFLKIYGINSALALPLPIDPSSLNGVTWVEYSTPVQNNTNNPNWEDMVGFSNYFFTPNSYVVLELWNTTYDVPDDFTFLGGAQFTITQLQTFQATSNIVVTNSAGLSPGTLTVTWSSGQ